MKFMVLLYTIALLTLTIFISAERDIERKVISHDNSEFVTDEVPRVKIKVFRGPLQERDGEEYSTWGFWVRQPAGVD